MWREGGVLSTSCYVYCCTDARYARRGVRYAVHGGHEEKNEVDEGSESEKGRWGKKGVLTRLHRRLVVRKYDGGFRDDS